MMLGIRGAHVKAATLLLALLLAGAVGAQADSRFSRPVIKPVNDKELAHFKLDGNNIAVQSKGSIGVSCIVYRGTKRYYVEIGVLNQSDAPIALQRGFARFTKPGYTVFQSDTIASAMDVSASVAGPFVPAPPPPPTTTTTYNATATTYGNTTQVQGTATTTNNAGWYQLGQAIAARRYYAAQSREQSFATYLQMFANEQQTLEIAPKGVQLYIFTFEQIKNKKAPFTVTIQVADQQFTFAYKE